MMTTYTNRINPIEPNRSFSLTPRIKNKLTPRDNHIPIDKTQTQHSMLLRYYIGACPSESSRARTPEEPRKNQRRTEEHREEPKGELKYENTKIRKLGPYSRSSRGPRYHPGWSREHSQIASLTGISLPQLSRLSWSLSGWG